MENQKQEQKTKNSDKQLPISVVRCSYATIGDRVQIVNTLGKCNEMFGTVIERGEIELDNGERALISDWEYQLKIL